MPKPWYARINPKFWSGESSSAYPKGQGRNAVSAANTAVARRMAGIAASVQMRDHPAVAAAYLRTNMPYSVVRRSDMEIRRQQLSNSAQQNDAQGTQASKSPQQREVQDQDQRQRDLVLNQQADKEEPKDWVENVGDWFNNLFGLGTGDGPTPQAAGQPFMPTPTDPLGLGSEITGTNKDPVTGEIIERDGPAMDIVGSTLHNIGTGVSAAFSPIQVPLTAGNSNAGPGMSAEDKKNQFQLLDRARNGDAGAQAELDQKYPVNGQSLADIQGQTPLALGVRTITGTQDVTPTQAADMRRSGYDPDSFVSRYSWYFRDLAQGQHAVGDEDARRLAGEYGQKDTDSAREIVTSNYLNDHNIAQLTPDAQEFANRAFTGDAKANELVTRMNNASLTNSYWTANITNGVADLLGAQRGSEGAKWAGLATDVVLTWKADPIAMGTRALNSSRALRYGIDATTSPAAGAQATLDKITALAKPDDLSSAPAFQVGKVWNDDIIAPIDRVVQLNHEAAALSKTGRAEDVARATELDSQAGIIAENFARRHPDMMSTWDLAMGMRTGNYTGVRIVDTATEAGKAEMKARQTRFGAAGQSPFVPVAPEVSALRRPVWDLKYGADGAPTMESLNAARGKLMDELATYVWAEALVSGRPLAKGQRLLPGEVALNRQLRSSKSFNAIRDAIVRPDASLKAAMSEKGLVNFTGDFDRLSDVVISSGAGNYYKAEHVDRFSRSMERMHSRVAMSPSGRSVAPGEVIGSTETYRRLVNQFMPSRLANMAVNRWSMASPAEQMAQWRQTWETIVEMQPGLTRTPEGRDLVNRLTKGVVPSTDVRGARMSGPREIYTIDEADNVIKADGYELAASLYPYQMNMGFVVPNIRSLRQMGEKVEFISNLAGRSYGRGMVDVLTHLPSALTRASNAPVAGTAAGLWKVGKVANPANMGRQALELAVQQVAENGMGHLWNIYKARRGVVLEHLEGKVIESVDARAATKLEDAIGGLDEGAEIAAAYKMGNWNEYGNLIEAAGTRAGFAADELIALRRMSEQHIDYQHLVREVAAPRRAAARLLESVRRVRARYYEHTGAHIDDPARYSPHARWADEQYARDLQNASLAELEGSIQNQLLLDRGVDDLAEVANKGFGGKMTRTPNARQLLGTAGDSGAARWFREFDSRQWDELPGLVMRGVAHEATTDSTAVSAATRINDELVAAGKPAMFPPEVNTAGEMAEHLITNNATFRQQAMRLQYDTAGSRVAGPIQETEAIQRLANLWVRDLGQHMGLKVDATTGKLRDPAQGLRPLLDKVASGERATLDDISRVSDDLRPREVSDSLYVPLPPKGQSTRESVVNFGAKAYGLFVARPLQRLMIEPSYIANRNIMYRNLEGPIDELVGAHGFTRGQAATVFEYASHRYAANATFRGTDNVAERSMFSEMTENILMFNRAQEDFLRRLARVTSVNPAIVSRAALLTEAAQHSGMVYPQTEMDDEGHRQTSLVFVYPGSALTAKAFQEVGHALGWGDDITMMPLFSSLSSKVNFLNASLTRPIAFSATPFVGSPMRIVRDLFPETGAWITPTLAAIEGQNQETYFAEQSVLQQWMPAPIARLVPLLSPESADGQLASAIRNATVYYYAAGLMPGEDASPDDIENANNAIKEMAMNQLIWRAATGFFLPAAPQYDAPQGLGLPEVSDLTKAMGVDNLRGEWFDILQQESQKHGLDGFSYAATEWYRRYPHGESILNPEAFIAGTTRAPGTAADSGAYPSGEYLGAWVFKNRDWINDNRAIAYYMLPSINEPYFTPTVMRQQLNLGLRERKTQDEFTRDVAYAVGSAEWWGRHDQLNRELGTGSVPSKKAYADWDAWEASWRLRNPRTAAEMDRRQDPNYIHSELAPALQRLVQSHDAPTGVDLTWATKVWDHYNGYRERYTQINTSIKGNTFAKSSFNATYRHEGDRMFLGTPAQDLWKAMRVYETE